MELIFQNLNAADLRGNTLADLLVNVEADLDVRDHGRVIYSERAFPVAELARELSRWRNSAPTPLEDFCFESLSFDEPGAVLVSREDPSGWTVGSLFSGRRTSPVSWAELAAEIDCFVENVRNGIQSLGIDPDAAITGYHSDE
jgi:hypothetical protein